MYPLKCVFGVASGKILGFQVTAEWIKVDPDKTKSISTMPPPRTVKELHGKEYEAFLLGLSLVKQVGAMHLEIRGESKMLVNQMNGVYSLKEVTLAPFRAEAQRLLAHFVDATIVLTGQTNNMHDDCLSTLSSKLQFEGSEKAITLQRRDVSSTWFTQVEDAQASDWQAPIIHELSNSLSEGKVSLKELKNFFLLHGALYYRNPDGSLSRYLGDEEASE
ncbi:uncharacterized protein LOC113331053 [Papaver somniferum]|uniref:uncharacterized protein LOC113331053 n=1 Tax=Papaver somniferum TaxID=3469 RepID=UPI000E6F520F|nr:uncharacterized protein LOC113331053 [Papaver somniferum]